VGAIDDDYIGWQEHRSMLANAEQIAGQFSGVAEVWHTPFANPNPEAAGRSSVWFTAYPLSMITKPGCTFLGTLRDQDLWRVFERSDISAVHTGPLKRAGGIFGREATPSASTGISTGSARRSMRFQYRGGVSRMCEMAVEYGGIVIDDIVPGHT
jgi:hypothetical protein